MNFSIFNNLELLLCLLPGHVYWLDINNVYQGCNDLQAKFFGLNSRFEIIGKRNQELPLFKEHPETAHYLDQINLSIMESGELREEQEKCIKLDGSIGIFLSKKIPLKENKKIIGLLGISIEITHLKQKEAQLLADKEKAETTLDNIIAHLPGHVYWKDKEGRYMGCNNEAAHSAGFALPSEIVGKSDYELVWKEKADLYRMNDIRIMSIGKSEIMEEKVRRSDGEMGVYLSNKVPLRNKNDEIIGILGISLNITAQKEAEEKIKMAELENATYKVQLEAQEQFTTTANQVAHDIRSPLASLLMLVKSCQEIPEMERIALREAAISIGDIANHLLSKYKTKEHKVSAYSEVPQPILISTTLLQLLTDKKFQYKDWCIKFYHDFSQAGQFAFINVELSSFKRMISNLINNAVDAFEDKKGEITVKIDATSNRVEIIIEDNGKGIPPDILEKIKQKIAVTCKSTGHGIGLTQVRETLERNHGEMKINSHEGIGTQINLVFPRIQAPDWLAEKIILSQQDIVVILDDDMTIHVAWDSRFEILIKKFPKICLHHFEDCQHAINFINCLSDKEKNKIFLLTDFELLKQDLNGLHVIEKTKVKRSILVTSHYGDSLVRERASTIGTQILPKQLASEIPIIIEDLKISEGKGKFDKEALKKIDLILVDDNQTFAKCVMKFIFKNSTVDYYESPTQLRANLTKYSKDTKIYLDNQFESNEINGINFAKELHDLGYSRLYLLTGEVLSSSELPDYLTVIMKDDILDILPALKDGDS